MRIHHLTATAFGPFPDEIAVDFDALTAAGLFLIHGPTGAGKTSLLDAICFALFADVPGSARQARHRQRPRRPDRDAFRGARIHLWHTTIQDSTGLPRTPDRRSAALAPSRLRQR